MQQDDAFTTSGDDAARSEASQENPERVEIHGLLDLDPWLLEFFYMKCRAKKVVDANPDLYPVTDFIPRAAVYLTQAEHDAIGEEALGRRCQSGAAQDSRGVRPQCAQVIPGPTLVRARRTANLKDALCRRRCRGLVCWPLSCRSDTILH